MQRAAVETLGKLPPEVLATHAAALLDRLEDSNFDVLSAAVETLGTLSTEALATRLDGALALN